MARDPVAMTGQRSELQATTLILCDQVSGLEHCLNNIDGPVRFLTLVDTLGSRDVCEYLRTRSNTEELSRPSLFSERNRDFWQRYIQFLGWLNVKNHSPNWWAMTFTAKTPLSASIGLDVFNTLLIVELLSRNPKTLLVVTESPELVAQAKAWGKRTGISVVSLIKSPRRLRSFLRDSTPAGIIKASMRTCLIWFLARRFRLQAHSMDGHLVITTQTYPRSFSGSSSYRDAYFGPLVDHVASHQKKAIILGLMVGRPFDQMRILKTQDFGVPIFPVESWITLKDIFACTIRAIRESVRRFDPAETVEFDGIDLGNLVGRAVQQARHSGDFYLNLLMYYCGRSLGSSLRVTRCLYPYENRAWEKMLIQGLRASSPQTQIVGYQHASLAPIHANFFLGPDEAEIMPLPDSILTTGSVIQNWLEREGNYPPGIFKTACALRQNQSGSTNPAERRGETTRVLVALATSFAEHLNTILFVEKAFQPPLKYQVRVRPHPSFPLDTVLVDTPSTLREFFEPSTGSLDDDLEWADVVLYATSTVGLEAVLAGVPAIRLDLADFLDTDPMFGWDRFKWSVDDPSKLIETIRSIECLSHDDYLNRQTEGIEYANSYLQPITPDALRLFSDVAA
jgi:hypothetical protein